MMPPRLLEPPEEEVGPTQQQDLRRRGIALGQGGEVLVDHRLEEAGDDLFHRHPRLHEGVRVRLGEDAALAADLVEAHALVGHVGQPLAGHGELARGFLDEGAGAAAAGGLHVDLLGLPGAAGREEDGLHVLAADLGHEAHVGVLPLHAGGDGHHLLDHLGAHQRTEETRARAGEEHAVAAHRDLRVLLHAAEELEDLLRLAGIVALVVLPDYLSWPPSLRSGSISISARLAFGCVSPNFDHQRLDGGGADVHADVLHAAASREPVFFATWRIMLAAVPAQPMWGTL